MYVNMIMQRITLTRHDTSNWNIWPSSLSSLFVMLFESIGLLPLAMFLHHHPKFFCSVVLVVSAVGQRAFNWIEGDEMRYIWKWHSMLLFQSVDTSNLWFKLVGILDRTLVVQSSEIYLARSSQDWWCAWKSVGQGHDTSTSHLRFSASAMEARWRWGEIWSCVDTLRKIAFVVKIFNHLDAWVGRNTGNRTRSRNIHPEVLIQRTSPHPLSTE